MTVLFTQLYEMLSKNGDNLKVLCEPFMNLHYVLRDVSIFELFSSLSVFFLNTFPSFGLLFELYFHGSAIIETAKIFIKSRFKLNKIIAEIY